MSDAAGQLTQENDPPKGLLKGVAGYRDFLALLAQVRTHLDDFSEEADYLMACGYKMARSGFADSLKHLAGLGSDAIELTWEFDEALVLITSTEEHLQAKQAAVQKTLSVGRSVEE